MPDSSPRLARSAGVFGLATFASRILGLVRDQVVSYYFGAGPTADAFRVAGRIPNLVRDLFAEGAMSAAFVPTFTRQLALHGRERAWTLASSVINSLILVTGILVFAGIVFAEPLVRTFAPEFSAVPGQIALTAHLTRIMLPLLTLVAVAAALMGMLNSLGHFFVPALSPAMFNVAIVLVAIVFIPLAPSLGVEPITIVAIGTVVGGVGQLLIQWPPLRREGFHYRARIDFRDEGLHRVMLLMGPGTIGMATTQINVFVNTMLATSAGTGAVTYLDLAFRLMYLPIGLFGVSIAAASTPAISRLVAERNFDRIRSTLAGAITLMLLLNVPATLGLIVLAEPIVAVIFERGRFTAADTMATAAALQFYALGLVGYSVVRIVSPTFYSLHKSRIPVMVSMASVVVNVGFNWWLVGRLGFRGLALGTSITALLNACVQLWLLRRELKGIDGGRIIRSLIRIVAASAAMAVAAWGANLLLAAWLPGQAFVLQLVRLTLSIGAALVTLAVAAQLLRIQEFGEARDLVLGRFRRMVK
jgi:putative peptidoglycan lipid II flippase